MRSNIWRLWGDTESERCDESRETAEESSMQERILESHPKMFMDTSREIQLQNNCASQLSFLWMWIVCIYQLIKNQVSRFSFVRVDQLSLQACYCCLAIAHY